MVAIQSEVLRVISMEVILFDALALAAVFSGSNIFIL